MRRVSSPVFIDRDSELALLELALARAANGDPAIVVVGGDAGIGKTRLVKEFAASARRAGSWVFSGGCLDIGEEGLPYAPFVEAFRGRVREVDEASAERLLGPARGELSRIVPDLAGAGDEAIETQPGEVSQARLFELFLGFLERLAAMAPSMLLILEDLQWADRPTRDLLAFLTRNLQRDRVMIVATYRADVLERAHPLLAYLAELERQARVERIALRPFTREELRHQLTAIRGNDPPHELTDRIYGRSEGNPFFAEELVVAADSPDGGVPLTLRDLLLERLATLPATTQALLRVAAVAGRQVSEQALAEVSDVTGDELTAALREATNRGVLVADSGRDTYSFRHALFQEVAYSDLLPGERRRLHQRFAELLSQRSAYSHQSPPMALAELAHHWDSAGREAEALVASVEAAQAASTVHAYQNAHHLYERALARWPNVPDAADRTGFDLVTLLWRAAEAADLAGESARAIELMRQSLGSIDENRESARAGVLHSRLGYLLWVGGENDAALVAHRRAVELVPPDPPSVERATVLAGLGGALSGASQYHESVTWLDLAVTCAQAAGARLAEGRALGLLGYDLVSLGDFEGGLSALEESRQIFRELGLVDQLLAAYQRLALALVIADRLEDALAVELEGIDEARRLGVDRRFGVHMRAIAADILHRLGRWPEADRVSAEGIDVAGWSAEPIFLHIVRGRVLADLGHLTGAKEHLEAAKVAAERDVDPDLRALLAIGLAEAALIEARLDDARAAVASGLEALASSDEVVLAVHLLSLGLRTEAERAERARRARSSVDLDDALRRGGELLSLSQSLPRGLESDAHPSRSLSAHLATAMAEASRLEGFVDPSGWAEAATAWGQIPMPQPAAYAVFREAEAVLKAGGPRPLVEDLLRRAHETAVSLGAVHLASMTEDLGRRAHVDLGLREEAAAESTGPRDRYALTARELEVLRYLAAGRSDAEIAEALFITKKTASVHISNIKGKLGAASRVEAATTALRLGLVDEPEL